VKERGGIEGEGWRGDEGREGGRERGREGGMYLVEAVL